MVISVITTEYKVKRVLIDHGSSTNILYLLTYRKLGLPAASLEVCLGMLYGFVDEQVMIKGIIKIWADHRVARRCYEENLRIGSQPSWVKEPVVKVLDLNLDPRCKFKCERPLLAEDLKKIKIGPSPAYKTRIGTTLAKEEKIHLMSFF
ncbi:hypothetical protein CR513_22931, partial [Mucuna pruriens]